jgi:hypothetical protein
VIVSDIRVSSFKDWCELQAQVKSDHARKPFLLRYCYPRKLQEFLAVENGDPFLPAVLLPAMRTGETVEIPGYVSPRLLHATDKIQALYKSFDKSLSYAQIRAVSRGESSRPIHRALRRGLFFSCGIDSYYSLFKNLTNHPQDEETITDLIPVRGFDISFASNPTVFHTMVANTRIVSRKLRKNTLPVATNVRELAVRLVDQASLYIGAAMASVALTLENVFQKVYVASSYSRDQLIPYGSHPGLDPLWSTEQLSIAHDTCETRRVDKARFIAQFPVVTDTLRTCTYRPFSASVYNCGICEKCLRTMVDLYVAGALHKCVTLPNFVDLRLLRRIPISGDARSFIEELVACLGTSETDLAIRCALEDALSRSASLRRRRRAFLFPVLPLAARVPPPLLRLCLRVLRTVGRSPPLSIFDLPHALR